MPIAYAPFLDNLLLDVYFTTYLSGIIHIACIYLQRLPPHTYVNKLIVDRFSPITCCCRCRRLSAFNKPSNVSMPLKAPEEAPFWGIFPQYNA